MNKKRSPEQEEAGSTEPTLAEPPAFIINLPDDPEASLAESKFKKAVYTLARVYPRIDEARAHVRTHSLPGARTRFEVEVFIEAPDHRFEFVEEGWNLLDVFDRISDKLKGLMTKPKEKTSYRSYPPRSEVATATE
jgi:ribosome-associated translation inhibitor RaiA